jgi:hypothetical protein
MAEGQVCRQREAKWGLMPLSLVTWKRDTLLLPCNLLVQPCVGADYCIQTSRIRSSGPQCPQWPHVWWAVVGAPAEQQKAVADGDGAD